MIKENERRKRKKRKYGQAQLKHARRGIFSCVLSGVSILMLVFALVIAYINQGQAAAYIGGMGMISLLLAVFSIYVAIKGRKEREKNYFTCHIGGGLGLLLVIAFIIIFCRGLV